MGQKGVLWITACHQCWTLGHYSNVFVRILKVIWLGNTHQSLDSKFCICPYNIARREHPASLDAVGFRPNFLIYFLHVASEGPGWGDVGVEAEGASWGCGGIHTPELIFGATNSIGNWSLVFKKMQILLKSFLGVWWDPRWCIVDIWRDQCHWQ